MCAPLAPERPSHLWQPAEQVGAAVVCHRRQASAAARVTAATGVEATASGS